MLILMFQQLYINESHFFTSISGLMETILMALNVLRLSITAHTFSNIFQLSIALQCIAAIICFIRLKQANEILFDIKWRLLVCSKRNNKLKQTILNLKINRLLNSFYTFHVQCCQSVFSQNPLFGYQLHSAPW